MIENYADELTARQERTDPAWDRDARIATCRDSLMRGLVDVEEAQDVYGVEVVEAALAEIQAHFRSLKFDNEAMSLVRAARAVDPKARQNVTSNYRAFQSGSVVKSRVTTAASLAATLLVGLAIGLRFDGESAFAKILPESAVDRIFADRKVEVNSDKPTGSIGSATLVFSIPETRKLEEALHSKIVSTQKIVAQQPPQKVQAEIEKQRSSLEEAIIQLEVLKRAAVNSASISNLKKSDADAAMPLATMSYSSK